MNCHGSKEVRNTQRNGLIDLSGVELTKLGFKKNETVSIILKGEDGALKPLTDFGSGKAHDPLMATLRDAIEKMNSLIDGNFTTGDYEVLVNAVTTKAAEDEKIKKQATSGNTLEQFLESPDLKTVLLTALLTSGDNLKAMGDEVLSDDQKLAKLVRIIGTVLHSKLAS